MTEKEIRNKAGDNPTPPGVTGGDNEIMGLRPDFTYSYFSSVEQALMSLKSGSVKSLIAEKISPWRYIIIVRDFAEPQFYYIQEIPEEIAFSGDYSNVKTEKRTEEQVIKMLKE